MKKETEKLHFSVKQIEPIAVVNVIFVEDHYYFAQLWSMFYTLQRLSLYMYNDNNQTRPTCLV